MVQPDTPLVELFAPAAESPIPLAVVDDQGRLLGVIPRVTLLAALAGDTSSNGSSDDDAPDETHDDGSGISA